MPHTFPDIGDAQNSWGRPPGLRGSSRTRSLRDGISHIRDTNRPTWTVGIWYTDNPCRVGMAQNDLLVEVSVSLEPRPHALGLGAPCRADSSLE
jgi:hypothetical protein